MRSKRIRDCKMDGFAKEIMQDDLVVDVLVCAEELSSNLFLWESGDEMKSRC